MEKSNLVTYAEFQTVQLRRRFLNASIELDRLGYEMGPQPHPWEPVFNDSNRAFVERFERDLKGIELGINKGSWKRRA
jgi:hypothetical protein